MEQMWVDEVAGRRPAPWEPVDRLLSETQLATFVQWRLGDGVEAAGIVERLARRGELPHIVEGRRGIRALARRDYAAAARHFEAVRSLGVRIPVVYFYEILAHAYLGQMDRARQLAEELVRNDPAALADSAFWDFAERRFGLVRPAAP